MGMISNMKSDQAKKFSTSRLTASRRSSKNSIYKPLSINYKKSPPLLLFYLIFLSKFLWFLFSFLCFLSFFFFLEKTFFLKKTKQPFCPSQQNVCCVLKLTSQERSTFHKTLSSHKKLDGKMYSKIQSVRYTKTKNIHLRRSFF